MKSPELRQIEALERIADTLSDLRHKLSTLYWTVFLVGAFIGIGLLA